MVLKLDKVQGIVAVNKNIIMILQTNYLMIQQNFEILHEDPTFGNLSTIQRYLNTQELKDQITKNENKQMNPKFPQTGRAHGLPTIHKQFAKSFLTNC